MLLLLFQNNLGGVIPPTPSTAANFAAWIMEQPGLSGAVPDRLVQYIIALGYASGQINDMMYLWLTGLGYTEPALQDKFAHWRLDVLGY
jgi:hypothetical protein